MYFFRPFQNPTDESKSRVALIFGFPNFLSQAAMFKALKKRGYTCAAFPSGSFCVQLFLFLNDLAGRWALLDSAARWIYIGALPVLGTLVGAQLLLLPRSFGGASRSKTALALVLSLALGALFVWGLGAIATAWHLGNLSPRPWMTRRVNWLIVEPQDDSFPCIEVLFAWSLSSASLFLNHKIGFGGVALALLLSLSRMFCGNNYFADVAVGTLMGVGLFLGCAAVARRHVPWSARVRGLSVGAVLVGGTLAFMGITAFSTPRFAGKLGFSPASASTAKETTQIHGPPTTFGEGEGAPVETATNEGDNRAEQVALAKRSSLFLPDVEAYLRGRLTPVARPLALLDVEVAPVKAGTTSFRCAEVRFLVDTRTPNARQIVADRAGRLTRETFALDSQMQNVDIIAVARDEGRSLDHSLLVFPGDEVPVFTASVQRKNVVLASPAWLNAPGLDGGSWLRARSRLYINPRALPNTPAPTPTVKPTPAPTQTPAPLMLAPPVAVQPTLSPTKTASPTHTTAVKSTQMPAPSPKPSLSPTKTVPRIAHPTKPVAKRRVVAKRRPVSRVQMRRRRFPTGRFRSYRR